VNTAATAATYFAAAPKLTWKVEAFLDIVRHARRVPRASPLKLLGPVHIAGQRPGRFLHGTIAFAPGADPKTFEPCGPGRLQLGMKGSPGFTPL
jgi:hypothetical protein